ncbi:MAG: hypothetical protein QNJ32_28070 [Xenococcaceae cyanobacterium MO_167.B27]|nr:hypothetical protein [Xenococcaceae cyanobacterium MO_167.B27]
MLERFRRKSRNCLSKSELEQRNKSLIYKNSELVKTIEELRLENSEIKQHYSELLTVNNELLAQLNKSHKVVEAEDSLAAEEVNNSETYLDSLTSRIVPLDENEQLKQINDITSKYYPVPIAEDDNNVVIRYLRYDETLGKMVRNTKPWKERITIAGERYYLIIESRDGERVWEITLMRYLQANMPPTYKLKAVTDRGEEFELNEDIANGDTQSISVAIELEEGEGLKFEIYPSPEDYVASRIFWFY